jgi:hypothetical protein
MSFASSLLQINDSFFHVQLYRCCHHLCFYAINAPSGISVQ